MALGLGRRHELTNRVKDTLKKLSVVFLFQSCKFSTVAEAARGNTEVALMFST